MAYETDATDVGTTTHVVVGLFDNANDAHQAINQLREHGFTSSQIGAAFRSRSLDRVTDRDANARSSGTAPHESWWEKIKDAFRPEEDKVEARREASSDATVGADPYAEGEYEYDYRDQEFLRIALLIFLATCRQAVQSSPCVRQIGPPRRSKFCPRIMAGSAMKM
jgi:hypothetical protein